MDITGSREQKHDGFTNWVLRASLANKHILEEKKKNLSILWHATLWFGVVLGWLQLPLSTCCKSHCFQGSFSVGY